MDSKRCTRCDLDKPLSDFHADKTKSGGRKGICKRCDGLRKRQWVRAHEDHNRAQQKAWRASHPELVRANNAHWNAIVPGESLTSAMLLVQREVIYDDPPTVTIPEVIKTRHGRPGGHQQFDDDSAYVTLTVERQYERTEAGLWPTTTTRALSRWRGERSSMDVPELVHTIA